MKQRQLNGCVPDQMHRRSVELTVVIVVSALTGFLSVSCACASVLGRSLFFTQYLCSGVFSR